MQEQVTLAAYADQNRALIHNERNNEALAICKHILRHFPKHLETYRQMGEAYLNLHDLDSAKDIFRRVLSADPEDLVAYLGLSAIFEQEQQYEEAVWHLERAYELAPDDLEIQKELLRLYPEVGIRVQQRLQMTPGALARLYTREGLYPQAIQELRAIVNESPTRFDAHVALAETLWNAGRLREAADVSEKLLAALPYGLKANLILGTVWKESGVKEGNLHLQRAQEVDPTNQVAQRMLGARSTLSVFPITVPRYVEGTTSIEQPTRTKSTVSSPAPISDGETTAFAEPGTVTTSQETDFFSRTPSLFDTQPALEAPGTTDEKTPMTDLPAWLTSESLESAETTARETEPDSQQTPLEAWFTETKEAMEKAEPSTQEPETFSPSATAMEQPSVQAPPSVETAEPSTAPTEEIPEWLKGWQIAPEEPPQSTEPASPHGLPDWLRGLQAVEETKPSETVEPAVAQTEEIPTWLAGLQSGGQKPSTTEEEPAPTQESQPAVEQSFADFLSNLDQEKTPPSSATTVISAEPEPQPATEEYRFPSFLGDAETSTPTAPPAELPIPDFLAGTLTEEKPLASSEAYPMPSFLRTQEPETPPVTYPTMLTLPTEELVAPEMPPTPSPIDTAPSIVVETPPAPAPPRARKPKRVVKGAERLAQARAYRNANETTKALAEYDYLVQRAPRFVNQVIDDLEVLVQRLDAPLEAHRILGDAYTRTDRLNDALEQYRFVMGHSPKASG